MGSKPRGRRLAHHLWEALGREPGIAALVRHPHAAMFKTVYLESPSDYDLRDALCALEAAIPKALATWSADSPWDREASARIRK